MKPHDWQKLILRKNENGGLAKDQNFLFQHPLEKYLDFYFILQKFLRKCESFTKKCMKRANFVHERTARYVHLLWQENCEIISSCFRVRNFTCKIFKYSHDHLHSQETKLVFWIFLLHEYHHSHQSPVNKKYLMRRVETKWENIQGLHVNSIQVQFKSGKFL